MPGKSFARTDNPFMAAGEVAGLTGRAPGLTGASICEFRLPVGDRQGRKCHRATFSARRHRLISLAARPAQSSRRSDGSAQLSGPGGSVEADGDEARLLL